MSNSVDSEKTKLAIDELMKTPEGQALADKIRNKLKDLNTQFKELSPEDREKFTKDFQEKFSETFQDVKESIKARMDQNPDYASAEEEREIPINNFRVAPEPNYFFFLIAFIIVLVIFGFFGYKLYKSIMEKELKKDKKSKKELKKEKKLNSPPASPRSKKEK
ncbi:hypothetical protein PVAND_007887 [Polypedilum vanderplanki]|uniref:Uncharacterized protein n=1 Tax=Polypedilum vanderplanki TaxID=319348 RepID=A0A9J6C828_POLVA|nr:hypothetical protein PVAND_007887 [Polypedilum vanderplanki]